MKDSTEQNARQKKVEIKNLDKSLLVFVKSDHKIIFRHFFSDGVKTASKNRDLIT